MFKPHGDMIMIEQYQQFGIELARPDNAKVNTGDTFLVKAVGPGWYTDSGKLIKSDIEVGDRVALAGKILKIPDKYHPKGEFLIARASDVIAVEPRRDVEIRDKVKVPDRI